MAVMEMTLNKVWEKLRKRNKGQYRQLGFCLGFAVMLIASYLMMLMSPLIQNTLPQGGDSRKQVCMIFVLAAAGCLLFVIYAAGLFLRYKSREIGVFLALGADKKKIGKALRGELLRSGLLTEGLGLAAGCVLSLIIGTGFKMAMPEVTDESFAFTLSGLLCSLLYAAVLLAVLMAQAGRFMKRGNLLDILNEQRKQEPLKKKVTAAYLVRGICFLAAGVLFGFVMPVAAVNLTKHYLGAWTNLFYLLALAGLYQILVYSISCHKKGKHPRKYYKNVISYGMLKFQGRSIVRNMLVITLLLLGGLFAVFYVPVNNMAANSNLAAYEAKYSYFYTENMKGFSREDVEKLASEHGLTIKNYRQARMLQAVGSGVNRDDVDENGNLQEIYEKRHRVYEFISASDYERLTGQKAEVERGTYRLIQFGDAQENLFFRYDDMDQVYLDKEDRFLPMKYAGNLTYHCLVQGRGFDYESRFVVNDADFRKIEKGTGMFPRETQVLFDSSGSGEVEFSEAFYRAFGLAASDDMKVCGAYDLWAKMEAEKAGGEYGYEGMGTYDPDNPMKEADWQYEPRLVPMEEAYGMASYAVFLLLFLYVAAVCLLSVGIISYARSQSVGLSGAPVFSDLEKLGASHSYLLRLLRQQIRKVYALPTVIGCGGMWAFQCLLLKMNDGRVTGQEVRTMLLCGLIALAAAGYQYLVYRFSFGKVAKMLGLCRGKE